MPRRHSARLPASLFTACAVLASAAMAEPTVMENSLGMKLVRIPAMRLAFGKVPVGLWLSRECREMVDSEDLVFEPDQERLTMTWRVARPLKKNMFEIAQVLVGKKGKEWWQKREEVAAPIPLVVVSDDREPAEK